MAETVKKTGRRPTRRRTRSTSSESTSSSTRKTSKKRSTKKASPEELETTASENTEATTPSSPQKSSKPPRSRQGGRSSGSGGNRRGGEGRGQRAEGNRRGGSEGRRGGGGRQGGGGDKRRRRRNESDDYRGGNSRGRRRPDGRKGRQEGIRDATASRIAAADARNSGNRKPRGRSGGGRDRGPARRKGLEILRLLQQQVSIDPYQRFQLETTPNEMSMRVMDLISPIGRGQRALIVSPPKAGKTTLLTQIANSLMTNHPEVKVYALLVDERPEEVTHFRRSTEATVFAASSDMSTREHIQTAEECMNTVVEPVLKGEDVVLLLDSITRLARAYNSVQGGSGRTLSGGLDANTMLAPRQIFGAARKIEHGGSLTILGTALVDTGSRMDEVIFQEFKGTGNTELVLSRDLFEKRIFPCVDISKSGTRKEEKLYPDELVGRLHSLRRLAAQYPPDKAMLGVLKLMQRHKTNEELLTGLAGLE